MAVNLTRIYTRTGDDGSTRLGDMSKTSKTDPRLVAYADTDEANSSIGVAVALGRLDSEVVGTLTRIQNELFDVGADLCNPVVAAPEFPPLRVEQADVDRLEADCDRYNEDLEKLRSFILPGGTPGSALLHVSRTVVRRAERSAWAALEVYGETMNVLTAKYLNRLSDLLFILARYANKDAGGDVLWVPGGSRQATDTDAAGNAAGAGS
jgi:cob(I)alamin adenosyltransferase